MKCSLAISMTLTEILLKRLRKSNSSSALKIPRRNLTVKHENLMYANMAFQS